MTVTYDTFQVAHPNCYLSQIIKLTLITFAI